MIYLYQNPIRFTTAEKIWLYLTKVRTNIYLNILTLCFYRAQVFITEISVAGSRYMKPATSDIQVGC